MLHSELDILCVQILKILVFRSTALEPGIYLQHKIAFTFYAVKCEHIFFSYQKVKEIDVLKDVGEFCSSVDKNLCSLKT